MDIDVNVHFAPGSNNPETTAEIMKAIEANIMFGLGNDLSTYIFDPHSLIIYWISRSGGKSFFQLNGSKAYINQIKMIYLTHKNFISVEKMLDYPSQQKIEATQDTKLLPLKSKCLENEI
jgi:hypothetical protein